MLKRLFDFFVFTSLFIALCAVLMVYQTAFLFGVPVPDALYGFVFCGTVCSYNFHWFLTPPGRAYTSPKLIWNDANRNIHLVLAAAALAGAGYIAHQLLQHWVWLCLTAGVTFLYSAPKIPHRLAMPLRRMTIAKTFFLAFAWTHVTTILPLIFEHPQFSNGEIIFVLNRFFLIYAICILFDFRDVAFDKKAGIKSIITELSASSVRTFFYGTVAVCLLTAVLLLNTFSPLTLIALTIPALIVAALYKKALHSRSDYLYYFILDGLMMFSLPLLLLVKFAA